MRKAGICRRQRTTLALRRTDIGESFDSSFAHDTCCVEDTCTAKATPKLSVERVGCIPLVASKFLHRCQTSTLFQDATFNMAAAEPTPPTGDDKLQRLQARLGGRYSVLKPGRSVLHEGILFQQGESEQQ
jgi:hypothetical protein